MKKLILLLLFLIVKLTYAEMPSLIGKVDFNSENYRNTVYDYIVEHSTKCIYLNSINKYEILCATGDVYGLRVRVHFSKVNESFRDKLRDKIRQVKGDSRTITGGMKIGVFLCHDDGIPGACKPDKILEWETK